MERSNCRLSREELAFERMKDFHLERVKAVADDNCPLKARDGGILVLHLIPLSSIFGSKSIDGPKLKEHGTRIRPLGNHGGNTRFNVDGFLNRSGYEETRAYSQLFRDGRLESVMSDVGYPLHSGAKNSPYVVRESLVERAVCVLVADYIRFCEDVGIDAPVWLHSALVECNGFCIARGRFRDLSETAVDRSPAVLPVLEITNFATDGEQLLQPWCDTFWQACGLERSFNYHPDGRWHEPR
jgi:hypothetical protein